MKLLKILAIVCCLVGAQNLHGMLIEAAKEGNVKKVEELLKKSGVNLNEKDSGSGMTALMWASYKGHEKVVKLLLEYGAKVDEKDNHGRTAFEWAHDFGQKNIFKPLILYANKEMLKEYPINKLDYLDKNMRDFILWLHSDSPRQQLKEDAPRFAPMVFAMPHFVEEFEGMMPFLGKNDFETIFTAQDIQNAIMTKNINGFKILIDQAVKNNYEDLLKLITQEIRNAPETKFNHQFLGDVKALLNRSRNVQGIMRGQEKLTKQQGANLKSMTHYDMSVKHK